MTPSTLAHLEPIGPDNVDKLVKLVSITGRDQWRSSFVLSPDRTTVALVGAYSTLDGSNVSISCANIWLWNMTQDQPRVIPSSNQSMSVNRALFSPDSRFLVTSEHGWNSLGYTLKLWNLATSNAEILVEHSPTETLSAFSPNNRYLVYGSGNALYQRDFEKGNTVALFAGDEFSEGQPAVSSDSRLIAIVTATGHLKVWDTTRQQARDLTLSEPMVEPKIFFVGDDRKLVIADVNGEITGKRNVLIWDLNGQAQNLLPSMQSDVIRVVSDQIIDIGRDGQLARWEIGSGNVATAAQLGSHNMWFYGLPLWADISPITPVAAEVSYVDGTPRFWNLLNGQLLRSIAATEGVSYNGTAFLWSGDMLGLNVKLPDDAYGVEVWGIPQ